MYRVMIVDDEYYVRKSFRNRIDWAAYEMEIVGEAANGEEAYRMVPQCRPDLMFVDIRMPVLDGFDLTTLLADEYADIEIIIISAYSDFQYARRAIEKGVFDYLLKPLEEEDMEKTLNRLLKKLAARRGRVSALSLYNLPEHPCENQPFCCIAVFEPGVVVDEEKQYEQLQEWLGGQGTLLPVLGHHVHQSQVYCLYGEQPDCKRIAGALRMKMSRAAKNIVIGISSLHSAQKHPDQEIFRYLTAEAAESMKEKIFTSQEKVFLWADKKKTVKDISPYQYERIEMIRKALSGKDYARAGKALTAYINGFDWTRIQDPVTIETIVGIVLEQLFKAGWDSGLLSQIRVYTNEFRKPNYLMTFSGAEEIRERLCNLVEILTEEMDTAEGSDLVQRILQYIEENYSHPLQMEDLEKQFYMSQSSLLMAFKKKKNMTISSYIEAVRMEKAKEFLKSGMYSVQDTAETVGYLDANYFCKVFKRYAGVTPSKYRMK